MTVRWKRQPLREPHHVTVGEFIEITMHHSLAVVTSGREPKSMTNSKPQGTDSVFDLDRLKELVELMKEHDVSEVELRHQGEKVKVRRGSAGVEPSPPPPAASPASRPIEDAAEIATINSPMVGTFYTKPNPESSPFVSVGDHVGPETVVCIIEAMKVFNEIPAEVSGQIVSILLDNEESVEFGRPLFKVDTSR